MCRTPPRPSRPCQAPGRRAGRARGAPRCWRGTASWRRAIRSRCRPGWRSSSRAATRSTPRSRRAVLDVTSQNDTGIGGDLFALVWVAREQRLYALNAAGWAPAGWTPEFFRDQLGVERMPGSGVNATTVPGAISGYDALLERFGNFTFRETFERAARIAEEGWGQAERRHADLASRCAAPPGGSRLGPGLPGEWRGAAALRPRPQPGPGASAAPDPGAGAATPSTGAPSPTPSWPRCRPAAA
jgi:hypothetical protein